MKILYVISDRNIGGAGIQLLNILRHLDRREFAVTVALPFRSRLRERLLAAHVRVRELENPCEELTPRAVCELMCVIREEQPDIVHTNAAVAARVAGKLTGRRVVFTRHCAYPAAANATPFAAKVANRLLTDRAVATASAAARDLVAMGVPSGAITVILNGSDPVREVGEDELRAWRGKLSLDADDFCVGICARLEPCKGHDVFLRAAKQAIERMPNRSFRFLIIGEGSRRAELERLAARLGLLSDTVRFTGFVSDVAPLYRLMRLHVNASRGTETSCLAVSEAMSAGVPELVSDYGGNREMIGESAAGIVFPQGNSAALADAICKVAGDKALEASMR
ncbi:MAG TPA: hypothetical protein DDW30_05270, partial [Clostridiales bacterium]|nr:hypothetical protein [Clostridiales bacterium]